jgi:hypothetical protein
VNHVSADPERSFGTNLVEGQTSGGNETTGGRYTGPTVWYSVPRQRRQSDKKAPKKGMSAKKWRNVGLVTVVVLCGTAAGFLVWDRSNSGKSNLSPSDGAVETTVESLESLSQQLAPPALREDEDWSAHVEEVEEVEGGLSTEKTPEEEEPDANSQLDSKMVVANPGVVESPINDVKVPANNRRQWVKRGIATAAVVAGLSALAYKADLFPDFSQWGSRKPGSQMEKGSITDTDGSNTAEQSQRADDSWDEMLENWKCASGEVNPANQEQIAEKESQTQRNWWVGSGKSTVAEKALPSQGTGDLSDGSNKNTGSPEQGQTAHDSRERTTDMSAKPANDSHAHKAGNIWLPFDGGVKSMPSATSVGKTTDEHQENSHPAEVEKKLAPICECVEEQRCQHHETACVCFQRHNRRQSQYYHQHWIEEWHGDRERDSFTKNRRPI